MQQDIDYTEFTSDDFARDSFFIRWVNGADPDAAWFWQSFIQEHPEKEQAIEEARSLVKSLAFVSHELSQKSFESMRNRVIMSIRAEKEQQKEQAQERAVSSENYRDYHSKNRKLARFWFKAAAVVAIPLLALGLYISWPAEKGSESLAIKGEEERVNPRGQKSVLLLSDGTKVWLNADSRLYYSKDLDQQAVREVFLEGEAYFDVAKDAHRPFLVHASAITIRVLGTAFNVKSYEEEETIETTLVHGKVSITKEGDADDAGSLVLKPNQKAIFLKKNNSLNVEEVLTDRTTAWRYDRLVFDETSFAEVIARLERWYNVAIHVDGDQNLKCKLTADIEKETLEEVLDLLVTSHQVTYSISGNEVFIKGSLCH